MLIGYVRVSTNDQNTDLQRNALNCAGCERIFEDKISGTKSDRPGLKNYSGHYRQETRWLSGSWTGWGAVCGILLR